jgi:hypothetical protein
LYNTSKSTGASDEKKNGYLKKAINQILKGNYTDDVNLLGTAGQIGLGLLDADLPADIRDLLYDVTHWDGSREHKVQTLLDAVGLIPGIGILKNTDEVAALLKGAKNSDEVAAILKGLSKNAAETRLRREEFGEKLRRGRGRRKTAAKDDPLRNGFYGDDAGAAGDAEQRIARPGTGGRRRELADRHRRHADRGRGEDRKVHRQYNRFSD